MSVIKLDVAKEDRVAIAAMRSRAIRGDRATTCCLHLVIDDVNISDADVAHCITQAAQREHLDCLRLALLLAECSLTQRARIHGVSWYQP